MTILCFGKHGLVSSELMRKLPGMCHRTVLGLSHRDCDITDSTAIWDWITRYRPTHIINAAAFTDVDACESQPEQAYAVNSAPLPTMCRAAESVGATLIHLSTDYVFDGRQSTPYTETDGPNPLNVYGASKYQAECAINDHNSSAYILRVQWLFGPDRRNFVDAILAKASQTDSLSVVADQWGSPTAASTVVAAIGALIQHAPPLGIYHLRSQEHTSWYEFARYFLALCGISTPVIPISTDAANRPAKRPLNGVMSIDKWLDTGMYAPPSWTESVRQYVNLYPYI
jgi:dTDP-4-dehydrorhamnose reductase